MENDHYAILDVSPSAGEEAIRAAYRRQMALYHPDKVTALGTDLQRVAEQRTKNINAAYAVLGNALSRAAYDRRIQAVESEPAPSPAEPPRKTAQPPHQSRPRRPVGPIQRGAQVAGIGFGVFVAAAIIAFHMPGMSHAALSTVFGLIINASLIVVYVGLYRVVHAVIAAMRAFGSRHMVGRMSESLVRCILILTAAFLVFFSWIAAVAFARQNESEALFYWVLLGVFLFAAFTLLLLAKTIAPRWVDRLLLRVSARWAPGISLGLGRRASPSS